jgi:hypothetical protein
MAILARFIVISYGPRGLTGKPNEEWFFRLTDAQDEVSRRIQVRRLHSRARTAAKVYGGRTWDRDGLEWRTIAVLDYRDVPKSNPEFESSGGCRIHEVRATTKDKPFDPGSLGL